MTGGYTERELMVVAAAREIRDAEVVFVGMRLPILAFALAKRTHAPGALGVFENGIVREHPAPETLYTMSDPPNVPGALWCTSTGHIMALLEQGLVDLGFIGGADIASLARRVVIIMPQERHRFVERVAYVTSPGYGDGPGWRERVGLAGGGPAAPITTLGVFRFDAETREAVLASYHPGQSVDSVRAATGWPLRVAADVRETVAPTEAELGVVRACDPEGFWTR